MERLICSSSPSSLPCSKTTSLNPSHLPPRLNPILAIGNPRFSLIKFSRSDSFLFNRKYPQFLSSSSTSLFPTNSSSSSSSSSNFRLDSSDGSIPRFPFLKQLAQGTSHEEKKATPVSAVILVLSAIILVVINPPRAFATVQSATKSVGGKVVRTELLSSAWTGFFAGCLHTLSGPDHLAALAPLSIGRSRMGSAAVGALWGLGHEAGQVIFGLLFLLLKDRLHIEVLQTWGTRVVGLTLLVIGAMGIKEASEASVTLENRELDLNALELLDNQKVGKKKIGFATFATGIIHGLQPDALMMVLPALALPSRLAGAAFLGMFLLGTVIAMGSYTVFIGSCTEALKERVPKITEKLTWASSLVAIALGIAILVSQYFGFSLY